VFTIESNIEIPIPRLKYPFPDMKVGDSFFCQDKRVKNASAQFGNRHGMKFTIRVVEGGYRLWRVA